MSVVNLDDFRQKPLKPLPVPQGRYQLRLRHWGSLQIENRCGDSLVDLLGLAHEELSSGAWAGATVVCLAGGAKLPMPTTGLPKIGWIAHCLAVIVDDAVEMAKLIDGRPIEPPA